MMMLGGGPSLVDAKTLYVDGSRGNDGVGYAVNGETTPWRMIGRAVWGNERYGRPNAQEAAQPGDTVLIASGIYWEGNGWVAEQGNPRFRVVLNPANSGTAIRPIVFRGIGTVQIRLLNGVRGPTIGCQARDHVVWDHVSIDETYGGSSADTGPVVFHVSTGCQLINSEVMGHSGAYHWGYPTYGGNYRLVFLEPARAILIRNNFIHRAKMGNGPGGQNEACVMAYDSDDNVIEQNDFADCGAAVFIKGIHPGLTLDRNVVRFNRITDCHHVGIRVLMGADNRVYQNIVHDCDTGGIRYRVGAATNTWVVNNTIVATGGGRIQYQNVDIVNTRVYNNIVVGPGAAMTGSSGHLPSAQSFTADRNLFFSVAPFAHYDGPNYSWTQWQGFGKDPHSLYGVDPLFVNAATKDYRLQVESPARTLEQAVGGIGGVDGTVIPAGAYLTGAEVIGWLSTSGSGGGDRVPPQAPQNLRVFP